MLKLSKARQLGLDREPPERGSTQRLLRDGKRKARAKALREALESWSRRVRGGQKSCVWCGTPRNLQAHHIVARSLCSTIASLDLRNGMTLCFGCHIHRLKRDPDGYIEVRDRYLRERGTTYERLRALFGRRGAAKMSEAEIRLVQRDLDKRKDGSNGSGTDDC